MASTSDKRSARVWRIVKRRHAKSAFASEGAFRFGGRWNSPGTRLVYTSDSLALAALELLVHLDPNHLIPDLMAIAVDIPAKLMRSGPSHLPEHLASSRRIGDAWSARMEGPALVVPSAIIPMQKNVLLNPAHPAFKKLTIRRAIPFRLDSRLHSVLP